MRQQSSRLPSNTPAREILPGVLAGQTEWSGAGSNRRPPLFRCSRRPGPSLLPACGRLPRCACGGGWLGRCRRCCRQASAWGPDAPWAFAWLVAVAVLASPSVLTEQVFNHQSCAIGDGFFREDRRAHLQDFRRTGKPQVLHQVADVFYIAAAGREHLHRQQVLG
jgi:hypothetical protein